MNKTTGYRPDIDGLRAIAVLSVVFYHARLFGFQGGFVGVDIFFVISGFLITQILLRDIDRQQFSIVTFYVRRIRRIIPAYFAVTLASFGAGLLLLTPSDLIAFSRSAVASAFFIANVYFAGEMSYFQHAAEQLPLLHLWSLSVEEQFYLVWPLFLLALVAIVPKRLHGPLLIAMILVGIGTTEWAIRHKSTTMVFFWAPFRAWELMIGALLAARPIGRPPSFLITPLTVLSSLCIALPVALYTATKPLFPGVASAIPCVGAALLIYLGGCTSNPASQLLGTRPLSFIGQISYSLYLWHWPVFAFTRVVIGRDLSMASAAAAISASFVLAVVSWRYIETPFRTRELMNRRRPAFVLAACATALVSIAGLFAIALHGYPARSSDLAKQVEHEVEESPHVLRCLRGRDPELINVDPPDCSWGTAPGPTAVLWGDSHAAAYFLGMQPLAEATGETIAFLGMQACDPLVSVAEGLTVGRAQRACVGFNQRVLGEVMGSSNIKRVYIAGYWTRRIMNVEELSLASVPSAFNAGIAKQTSQDLAQVVRELSLAGKEVVVLGEPPVFPSGGGKCVKQKSFMRVSWNDCATTHDWGEPINRLNVMLADAISEFDNAVLFNPVPVLCDAKYCRPFEGDSALYIDKHHLNEIGSKKLAGVLITSIDRHFGARPAVPGNPPARDP